MYTVDIQDAIAQARKLEAFPQIAQEEFVPAMQSAIHLSLGDLRAKAPVGSSGQLQSSVAGEVRYAAGDEVRGTLTASAVAKDGFRYGYALDASKRYHYRGKRKRTYRWFKGVKTRKRREVMALFRLANERIVNRLVVR